MRILRARTGFQADHSSSSYLFYAIDGKVSDAGQRIAHRFSSRAEVDEQYARYQKWGESELSQEAFPALLGQHYDVMASESYDSWHLMIAVPKTPALEELLRPFQSLDDGEFERLSVNDYGKRLVVDVYCEFADVYPQFVEGEDAFEELVEVLAKIRGEVLEGDVSFLQAVADFYGAEPEDGDEEDGEESGGPPEEVHAGWSKAELQQECTRRGVAFRKSWNKDQLREALASTSSPARRSAVGKPAKLSRAARLIVDSLGHR
jgi:hypothetical protein